MGFTLKLIQLILTVIQFLVKPIFWFIYLGKEKKVSSIKNDLLLLSATDLAAKIRKKEVSSETVVKAYIERIKEVNPLINAVVQERYDDAIQEARNVDQYLSKSSMNDEDIEKSKPLLGIPLTVKESCSLQDMENSVGHFANKGVKASCDGKAVSSLRSSGAIPLLVSNTPEFCMAFESINNITGTTRNPYDTTRTSGGSSGGEGALLGAGASVIGLGSDIAGSIRFPAYVNGIFGHKPTAKIVPIKGHNPFIPSRSFSEYLVLGPMTRYAKDLRLMMNVIVDPQFKSLLRLNEEVNLKKLNVYFMEEAGGYFLPSVDKEIKKAVRKAVEYLEQNGATIKSKKFSKLNDVVETLVPFLYNLEGMPNPIKARNDGSEDSLFAELIELYKCFTGESKITSFVIFTLLQKKIFKFLAPELPNERVALRDELYDFLHDNGVLIYPTYPLEPIRHYFSYFVPHALTYLVPGNILAVPSTNIPCGLNKNGLPVGIQVIAAPYQDRLCLAVAEHLEKCFGGWVPP